MCIDNKPRGPGMWKFNCSLLHDRDYALKVKQAIQETLIIDEGVYVGLLWEAIKLQIRTDTISYSALKNRSKNNTLLEYVEKSSKIILNHVKCNFSNKTIKRPRLSNGIITIEEKKILKELHSFYSIVYTTTHNIVQILPN
ncbi:hypothetical protein LSH36_817g00111 [Paralvinella palmiformis]|uniref:Uncharacterized protein n=1 Tax=Paralvinella palmiformis TaxID=53620 RepID=A0AAD9MUR3_9ANNE|nr:hypothetical protein LSH36_817g00111 [Paralvinella palmiformis]